MSDCGCNSNSYQVTPTESVASQLNNLIISLFGELTKTITNGRAVWSTPCSTNESIDGFPRNAGEGAMCYLLRIFAEYFTPFKGTHNAANAYYQNDIVSGAGGLYKAISDVPIGTLISNVTYWELILSATTGPQGPAGPAGSGSAIDYAVVVKTADYTATDTDAVIMVDPAAATEITLPAATAVAGKWYRIVNRTGLSAVTITPDGTDTINGAASYVLTFAKESILLVNDNGSDWSVF